MRPHGYMTEFDDRDKNITLAVEVIRGFEAKAVNGGKLELEIDRYGHVRLSVLINPLDNRQKT
jgi:hypothetical protein